MDLCGLWASGTGWPVTLGFVDWDPSKAFYKKTRTQNILPSRKKTGNPLLILQQNWIWSRSTAFWSDFSLLHTPSMGATGQGRAVTWGEAWGKDLTGLATQRYHQSWGWRQGQQAKWCLLHRRPEHSASFLCFHFPSPRNRFQRMMSVENDSTMHTSYSSIPTVLSLTVLKLSIKQHKGEKKKTSCSTQALLRLLNGFIPYPRGSRDPRTQGIPFIMLTRMYNPLPLLYPGVFGDGEYLVSVARYHTVPHKTGFL